MPEKPSCLAPLVAVGDGLLLDPEELVPMDEEGELPELPVCDEALLCIEVMSIGTCNGELPAFAKLTLPSAFRVSGLAARNVRVYLGIQDRIKFVNVDCANSHHVLGYVLLSPLRHARHVDATAPIGSHSIVLGHHLRVLPHRGHARALIKTTSVGRTKEGVNIHAHLQPWRASC